jgi:hypothetical protein
VANSFMHLVILLFFIFVRIYYVEAKSLCKYTVSLQHPQFSLLCSEFQATDFNVYIHFTVQL